MTLITGFTPEVADAIDHSLEHLEGNHADSLLFVARELAGTAPWAGAVDVLEVDPDGIVFELTGPDHRHRLPARFDTKVHAITDFQACLIGWLHQARAAQPDAPITSIERELQGRAAIETHVATVTAARRVSPSMVEVTLAGLDGVRVAGGDEFWYLMVPREGAEDVIAPGFAMGDVAALPPDRQPFGASYTTRRRRPETGELDLWIHLHHDTGVAGWAATAEPGATVAVWGPRRAYEPPTDTTSHLLIVDETGVPAAATIVDQLPVDHPVTILAAVSDGAHELPLDPRPATDVRWIHRDHDDDRALLRAVRDLDLDVDGLYAFGAAESREISAVRRHLRSELGMPQPAVHMTGYWRRDRVSEDA